MTNDRSKLRNIATSTLLLLFLLQQKVSPTLTEYIVADFEEQCKHVFCPVALECPPDSFLKIYSSDEVDDFQVDDYEGPLEPIKFHVEELKPSNENITKTTASNLSTDNVEADEDNIRQKREFPFVDSYEKDLLRICCQTNDCVCKKCPEVMKCGENEVAVKIQEAQAKPGNCCPVFKCVEKIDCDATNGLSPKFQEYWSDACTKCNCYNICENHCQNDDPSRQVEVKFKNCYSSYLQMPMMHGEHWFENDYCTECYCIDGQRDCLSNLCDKPECTNPVKVEGKCCPVCKTEINIETTTAEIAYKTVLENVTTTTEAFPINSENNTNSLSTTTELYVTTNTTTSSNAPTDFIINSTSTVSPMVHENKIDETSTFVDDNTTLSTTSATLQGNTTEMEATTAHLTESSTELNSSTSMTIISSADVSITDTTSTTSTTTASIVLTDSSTNIATDSSTNTATASTTSFVFENVTPNLTNTTLVEETSTLSTTATSEILKDDSTRTSVTSSISTSTTTERPKESHTTATENFSTSPTSTSISTGVSSTTTDAPTVTFSASSPITDGPLISYSTTDKQTSPSTPVVTYTSAPAPAPLPEPQPTSYRQNVPGLLAQNNDNEQQIHPAADTVQKIVNWLFELPPMVITLVLLLLLFFFAGTAYIVYRCTRSKKNLYSTVPISDLSLSQSSTNSMSISIEY